MNIVCWGWELKISDIKLCKCNPLRLQCMYKLTHWIVHSQLWPNRLLVEEAVECLTHSIPGMDVSVPAIMAVANQVQIYQYMLVTTLRLFLFGAKVCVLKTVSYNHFLNASAQCCSHMLAIFNHFWYTCESEWTAAEQLVWGRKCTQHSWGKMS